MLKKLSESESKQTITKKELNKILDTSIAMRNIKLTIVELEAQLKVVEEMLSTIKGLSYNINNYLTYKKILAGEL